MASKLIIDRIPPDMHVDEKGNIVWTPRLIDFNAAAYTRGHVVTADEFNTELIKQTYQGNYNTDTISVLIGLYNDLKVDVSNKANTANTNAATALSRVNIAEANSIEALGTANTALSTSEDALTDVQAAVSASTEAVTIAENTINIAETAKALSEDASDKADAAVLDAEEAMRIAEGADAVAIGAEDIANEAKQIAEAANNTSNTANTNASNAVNTANTASQTANEAKSTASTAAYSAGNAVTTANTASTNASTALNTANTANTTSATALTKASEAVTTANTAVTTANAAKEESANAINVADTAGAKIEQAILDINEAKAVAEEAAASVADKASTSYVTEVLKDYYDSATIDQMLSNISVDLSGYYTSVQTDDLLKSYVTETELAGKGYLTSAPVSSVNGKTGAVNLTSGDVGALPNYTLTIHHQSAGNPRLVKFVSVNYATSATCFKMGAMTCHDNGISYQFLTDILIAVTTAGEVTANIYKFAQSSVGNVDGVARYTGDVFYVNDTTNKIVDFYILCGQYSSSQFTPVTKVGSTTIAYVTQYTGNATYYSSGTKVWVSGCGSTYARTSDIPNASSFVTTDTTQTITGKKTFSGNGLTVSGRAVGSGDDEGIVVSPADNNYAGICLGNPNGKRTVLYLNSNGNSVWRFNNGSNSYDLTHPAKGGTVATTGDIPHLYLHNIFLYSTNLRIVFNIYNTSPTQFTAITLDTYLYDIGCRSVSKDNPHFYPVSGGHKTASVSYQGISAGETRGDGIGYMYYVRDGYTVGGDVIEFNLFTVADNVQQIF